MCTCYLMTGTRLFVARGCYLMAGCGWADSGRAGACASERKVERLCLKFDVDWIYCAAPEPHRLSVSLISLGGKSYGTFEAHVEDSRQGEYAPGGAALHWGAGLR